MRFAVFFLIFADSYHYLFAKLGMKGFASQKVSLGEKIGYSMGDAAANLVFQMMMCQFLSAFYIRFARRLKTAYNMRISTFVRSQTRI